jgi:hypothetical protein
MLVHELPVGMLLNNGDQSFQQLNVECVPSPTACPMEVRGMRCTASTCLITHMTFK